MKTKEIAKFLSGMAANQVLTHGAFVAGGVQFEMFGILYDRSLNTMGVVFWSAMLAVLVYHAWLRNEPPA